MSDWNKQIIEEFHANGGKVGGPFEGVPLLLLTTTGAKSGKSHTTPLAYFIDGDRFLIVASFAGAPKHPAWYHNILTHPQVSIELGVESYNLTATVITGEERERLWSMITTQNPVFAGYQTKTTRKIPVVALQR
ncbi:nitroreductase family deazaflavin-dependent oxidoreductase [Ktedonospora formicarum]|uniref:Nitroreductase family deazaflavin-dependent oxidoreductase n=1 Tax=Ktedonospora formicarum TaxID=2778364 RepID=A0A8J3HUU2_9CHLR|nr:nitroreductase family deazaflavin-dependent oxidoreductase [Ktedonospora formicarum]GHO42391.1 hypothetical protein KSX_05540 [Ktedonospora formicarum]